jgi:hypothetical protein
MLGNRQSGFHSLLEFRFQINPVLVVFLFALWVGSWVFFCRGSECELHLYQKYAESVREESLEGLYATHDVEYPPMAILFMVAADAVARSLPDCSPLGSISSQYQCPPGPFVNFKVTYRLITALVAAGTFVLLFILLRRFQPGETRSERCERLLTFVLGLALLSQVAFDRLDLLLGALMVLSLGLLLSGWRPVWSLLVLALAIAYKIAPVALAPLCVLGSVPVAVLAGRGTRGGWRRLLLSMGRSGLLLAALTLLFFLPFYLVVGPRCLAFFTFHKERGIEIESTFAALLGTMKHMMGYEITARGGHGSVDIVSSLSPMLTWLAPVVMGSLFLGATLLLVGTVFRSPAPRLYNPEEPTFLAAAHGAEFTGHVLLLVLIFLFANKVFSPQFVLWLLPLVPLAPLARWPRRLFQGGFLGLCLVTHFIYPHYLEKALYGKALGAGTLSGPSVFGTFLLVTRTVLLLGLIVGLTVHLLYCYYLRKATPLGTVNAFQAMPEKMPTPGRQAA